MRFDRVRFRGARVVTLALSGHAVVGGIAVGQTHIIQHNELDIGEFRITGKQVQGEIRRLGS